MVSNTPIFISHILIHTLVLNERSSDSPSVVKSTTIGDVIDEGRSERHRPLNVLSIPLLTPGLRSVFEK
jgi:hypothetical protein